MRREKKKHLALGAVVAVLYLLHQDIWFWHSARPLVFGFLPIGLFYHACYTLATSFVLWLLVRYAWPAHLERVAEEQVSDPSGRAGKSA
ncbi:MAG: DUF3311 domain-containing protein [Bryobacteraceae bacterium]